VPAAAVLDAVPTAGEVLPVLEVLALEVLALEVLAALEVPFKSLINFSNAELRFDSTRGDTPEAELVPLRSCTSAFSSAMMPRWP
jgi:hypothetical protein